MKRRNREALYPALLPQFRVQSKLKEFVEAEAGRREVTVGSVLREKIRQAYEQDE